MKTERDGGPSGLKSSLPQSAAPVTAATSPHSQLPPAEAFLLPSSLRNTGVTAPGPREAADPGEMLLRLPSGAGRPRAPPTWLLRDGGAGRAALLQVMRFWRLPEKSCAWLCKFQWEL